MYSLSSVVLFLYYAVGYIVGLFSAIIVYKLLRLLQLGYTDTNGQSKYLYQLHAKPCVKHFFSLIHAILVDSIIYFFSRDIMYPSRPMNVRCIKLYVHLVTMSCRTCKLLFSFVCGW